MDADGYETARVESARLRERALAVAVRVLTRADAARDAVDLWVVDMVVAGRSF